VNVTAPQATLDSTLALVTRAREGDRSALELIAARYLDVLTRFAHGRLPPHARGLSDTCDIVQVAITRTLERLDAFDPSFPGALLAYMRRAVLNQIRDEIRRSLRRPPVEALRDDLPDRGVDPLENAVQRDLIERYEAALSQLTLEQQKAIILRLEMNLDYAEIARALGRPTPDAARTFIGRAVEQLSRRLKRSASP